MNIKNELFKKPILKTGIHDYSRGINIDLEEAMIIIDCFSGEINEVEIKDGYAFINEFIIMLKI